jgi:hydrogenase maturation protease
MRVFLGGVGELFQGDLDAGRLAVERLSSTPQSLGRPGLEVWVEDLHYGAVAVAQRLGEVAPSALVLFGAVRRGLRPGSVRRRRLATVALSTEELQAAVGDAVTGYVGMDLVVEVAAGLGVLPARTVLMEMEPERLGPGEGLSDAAAEGLETVVSMVRSEVADGASRPTRHRLALRSTGCCGPSSSWTSTAAGGGPSSCVTGSGPRWVRERPATAWTAATGRCGGR